jgi:hypothetical protein
MGIRGIDEVLEADLEPALSDANVAEALRSRAPDGLVVEAVESLPPTTPPAKVRRVTYELPVPPDRCPGLAGRIESLKMADSLPIVRGGQRKRFDLRDYLEGIECAAGVLRMHIRVTPAGTARPREVLESLGLEDLEQRGFYLTRIAVELEP